MLAQHLITKPVFDTLFKDNEFTANNPVSKAMETVLTQLDQHNLEKESESLKDFMNLLPAVPMVLKRQRVAKRWWWSFG